MVFPGDTAGPPEPTGTDWRQGSPEVHPEDQPRRAVQDILTLSDDDHPYPNSMKGGRRGVLPDQSPTLPIRPFGG